MKTGTKDVEPFLDNEVFPADISELPVETLDDQYNNISKEAFEKYLGKPFSEVRDDLKDVIRNAVAHIGDFDKVLDADRYDDLMVCSRAIPVLKYMARKMLGNTLSATSNSTKPQ